MKKVFLIILSAAIIICCIQTAVFADESASGEYKFYITTDSKTVRSGAVDITYDGNNLELTEGNCELSGVMLKDFKLSDGKGVFAFSTDTKISGNVFSVVFKAKPNAVQGTYVVKATLTLTEASGQKKSTDITLGTITVGCAHSHIEHRDAVEPTCTEAGYTAGEFCNDCNTYVSGHEQIAPTGKHSYSEWYSVDDNSHLRICSWCRKNETAPHSWDNGKITSPATEMQDGVIVYTCTICGTVKTEAIPKLDSTQTDITATTVITTTASLDSSTSVTTATAFQAVTTSTNGTQVTVTTDVTRKTEYESVKTTTSFTTAQIISETATENTNQNKKSGCSSSLYFGGFAVVIALLFAVVVFTRKQKY